MYIYRGSKYIYVACYLISTVDIRELKLTYMLWEPAEQVPVLFERSLTLLLLVPFPYKLIHHLKPFAIVVLNGEITVYSVDSPNGFQW